MNSKLLIFLFPFIFSSCFIVKYNNIKQNDPVVLVASKPSIRMSNVIVRSEIGDMIALLPEDWYFIDMESLTNNNIYAVATNLEYNLSLVFSKIKITPDLVNQNKDQLRKVANKMLNMHIKKSSGRVEQIGKIREINIAHKKFIVFDISTTSGALLTNIAIFKSELDNFYKLSLIPMNILGRSIPNEVQKAKIFNSVLATVKY